MAALATQTPAARTTGTAATVTFASAAGGGDTFTNTGSEVLIVRNADSSPHILTVVTSQTVDSQAVADLALTIPATSTVIVRTLPKCVYGSTVSLTWSATTGMTIAVVKVTPELV